jgi:hypothetical protein
MNGIVPKERLRSGAHVSLSFQLDLNIQTEKQKQLLKKTLLLPKVFSLKKMLLQREL